MVSNINQFYKKNLFLVNVRSQIGMAYFFELLERLKLIGNSNKNNLLVNRSQGSFIFVNYIKIYSEF